MAPAKTPEPVAARLHAELTALAATPDMREQAIKLGMLPVTSPSLSQLRGFLPREIDRWGKLVQQAGIAGSGIAAIHRQNGTNRLTSASKYETPERSLAASSVPDLARSRSEPKLSPLFQGLAAGVQPPGR